jgi:hypothetical protein
LEDAGCVGLTLASIVISLLIYVDDIVLITKILYDLSKQLITLKDFVSSMGMTMNIDKTKVMIIKSKRITYNTFFYDKNNLEELPSLIHIYEKNEMKLQIYDINTKTQ